MKYTLKRSKRKSISLTVDSAGEVVVKAPNRAPKLLIDQFVNSKSKWIEEAVAKAPTPRSYTDGEKRLIYGEEFALQLSDEVRKVELKNGIMTAPKTGTKEAIEKYYKTLAREYFVNQLEYYNNLTGLQHEQFRLKNNKTNWGSCSSKGNINLNWRLVMAPTEVIDYVILHEVCHLEQMNHSSKFWDLVAKYEPNYKQHKKWLKQNSGLLRT